METYGKYYVGEHVGRHHDGAHERADEEEAGVHEARRRRLVDGRQDRAAASECRAAYHIFQLETIFNK